MPSKMFDPLDEAVFGALGAAPTTLQIIDAAVRISKSRRVNGADPLVGFLAGQLERRLRHMKPFSSWEGRFIYHDDGGQGIEALAGWGMWLAERIGENWTAEQMLERAHYWIEQDSAVFQDIFVLSGLQVTERVELDAGIFLARPETLPRFWDSEKLFELAQGPVRDTGQRVALVIQYKLEPISGPRAFLTDEEVAAFGKLTAIPMPPHFVRQEVAKAVRRALLLAGDGAVEVVAHYTAPAAQDYPSPLAPAMGRFEYPPLPRRLGTFDFTAVAGLWRQIWDFLPNRPMRLALDRLGNARLENGADAAVDLGIAIDVLMRHGDGNNRGVTKKVAARIEQLLGSSERGEEARQLYKARSEAVHEGELQSTFPQSQADALVVAAAKTILALGKFPVWD